MNFALNRIMRGDALGELKKFPDESIDCVVTSPPYWALRDYGTAKWKGGNKNCDHLVCKLSSDKSTLHPNPEKKKMETGIPCKEICAKCGAERIDQQLGLEPTFQEYITKLCNIFDEVKRALKKTGTCWVNLGDTYSGSHQGYGKNSLHRVLKKEIENLGSVKNYLEKYKHIINQAPPSAKTSVADKSLCMIPFRFAIEMVNRGWILRNTIIWWKPNCMPSSVKDRFTVDFEYLFFFVKNKKYWFETQYEPLQESSLLRAKYNSYSSKTNKGIHGGMNLKNQLKVFEKINKGELSGRNKRCVWRISTSPFRGAHFAVFPEELVETPIKAGCPEFVCKKCGKAREPIIKSQFKQHSLGATSGQYWKVRNFKGDNTVRNSSVKIGYTDCGCNVGFRQGVVLDPFMGSGTTAVVAKKFGRNYIGIELNPKYIKMAERRIKAVSAINRRENGRTLKPRQTGI